VKCSDKDVVATVWVCKTCLGKLLVCPQPCLAHRGHDLVMNRFYQLLAGTGGEGSRERFWSRLASQAAWVRYLLQVRLCGNGAEGRSRAQFYFSSSPRLCWALVVLPQTCWVRSTLGYKFGRCSFMHLEHLGQCSPHRGPQQLFYLLLLSKQVV